MKRPDFSQTDRVRVLIRSGGKTELLGRAASEQIKLYRVRPCKQGYAAELTGRDLVRLQKLAGTLQVSLEILQRKGPGKWLSRLWQRPGIWVGFLLFCAMLWFLSGFIWRIDFGTLEADQIAQVRAILQQENLCEGNRPARETLKQANERLSLQPELFGWVSLNFSGGCLYVETTPLEQQQIRTTTPETALYAAADAEVVSVKVESGFTEIVPGQYVAKGQLLANALRADRDGDPVYQAAAGSVPGRIRQQVSAEQPLQLEQAILPGRSDRRQTLHLLGIEIPLQKRDTPPFARAKTEETWQPLTIGQLSLPGCLYQVVYREQTVQTVCYSQDTAEALARRSCIRQLIAQWPDAVIEQQSYHFEQQDGQILCRAEYVFLADIATEGKMQSLPGPQDQ